MKIRISKNGIRYRIQQKELLTLHEDGVVSERLCFGSMDTQTFTYAIEASAHIKAIDVMYADCSIKILVPAHVVKEMVETDRIGIRGEKQFDDQTPLSLLVEKDFKCLSHREEDADAFPHPDEHNGGSC